MEPDDAAPTPDCDLHTALERARIERLQSYRILDTERETQFDRIVYTAAQMFRTPIALLSFVDATRQWFKSGVGLRLTEMPRGVAFCAHTIKSDDVMIIEDATQDARFVGNPLVTEPPFVRFYAGAPLIGPDGLRLGSLCVLDTRARNLTTAQANHLRLLAQAVIDMLETRRETSD